MGYLVLRDAPTMDDGPGTIEHSLSSIVYRPSSSAKNPVHKRLGIKLGEVIGLFTRADETHGETELLLDREDDAALGGAVQLGQDDASDMDGFLEVLCLADGV